MNVNSNFWAGFEKQAGAVSDAMKRLGMNLPHLRKNMAGQLRKNRKDLLEEFGMKHRTHKGKLVGGQLQADIEHGGKALSVEHGASGLPAAMHEYDHGYGARGKTTHPASDAGRFNRK